MEIQEPKQDKQPTTREMELAAHKGTLALFQETVRVLRRGFFRGKDTAVAARLQQHYLKVVEGTKKAIIALETAPLKEQTNEQESPKEPELPPTA